MSQDEIKNNAEEENVDENIEESADKGIPMYHSFQNFDELELQVQAEQKARIISELADAIPMMISNSLTFSFQPEEAERKVSKIFSGFMDRMRMVMGNKLPNRLEDAIEFSKEISEKSENQPGTFKIFRNKETGQLLWLSAYSNNIRDEDVPPEIISSESHKNFVKMVDSGEVDMPELWMWHIPDLVIGKATAVAYDEETGFAWAAGYFNKSAEEVAIAISTSDVDWGVSHGMPVSSLKRADDDSTVIIQHVTKEISILPLESAANKFASFTILKEENMALDKNKRREFVDGGIPEEALDALHEENAQKSELVDTVGIERKEKDAETDESLTEEVSAQSETEETQETEEKAVFTEEQMIAIKESFDVFAEKLSDTLAKDIPAMIEEIVAEKMKPIIKAVESSQMEQEEQLKGTLNNTPTASLIDLVSGVSLKRLSATKSSDTLVGESDLNSGPVEAEEEDSVYPIGVAGVLNGSYRSF